jgi:hypothetical protein
MKQLSVPVLIVSTLVLIYALLPQLGFTDRVVLLFFLLLPPATIWMVFRILKDGTPSTKVWEEHFYEDYSYNRRGREEKVEK